MDEKEKDTDGKVTEGGQEDNNAQNAESDSEKASDKKTDGVKKDKAKETIEKIAENYNDIERSLVAQLGLATPVHPLTTGTYRETVWKSLFDMLIPKKYCITQSVFIIDSYGEISREVDLAVYDETYTPYIFNYGKIKFIPIEAVSVVIQCKSQISGGTTYDELKEWVESIDCLKTSLDAVTRMANKIADNNELDANFGGGGGTQTSTRPVKILCATGISEPLVEKLKENFDFQLYIKEIKDTKGKKSEKRLKKVLNNEHSSFMRWNDGLNHYGHDRYPVKERPLRTLNKKEIGETKGLSERNLNQLSVSNKKGEENVIMSLTFQLNQLLMLINNPMLFPHRAYAERFSKILGGREDMILAKYDVSGIQSYIFATNRLAENAGASINVRKILHKYLPEALKETLTKNYDATPWEEKRKLDILCNQNIPAEIVYIGGGNAFVLFRGKENYDAVSKKLAMKAAENCRGVTVFTAFVEAELKSFGKDLDDVDAEMAMLKRTVPRPVELSPCPLVEQDSTYGLPIVKCPPGSEDSASYMSALQYEKHRAYKEGGADKAAVQNPFKDGQGDWKFPIEMEDLIRRKGEDSYVAVVHIDGNDMGSLIKKRADEEEKGGKESYQAAARVWRNMSKEIAKRNEGASQAMHNAAGKAGRALRNRENTLEAGVIPFRPLIMEGDDLTFICEARFALPSVVKYLRKLLEYIMPEEGRNQYQGSKSEIKEGRNQPMKDHKQPLAYTACAGIAFVHSHFPFRIAYEIAEECCASAKKEWYRHKASNQAPESASCYLDFHVVQGAYTREMKDLERERLLKTRPLCVGRESDLGKINSYERFYDILKEMTKENQGRRKWPQNRLERLYKALLKGEAETKVLVKEFASRGYSVSALARKPGVPGNSPEGENGRSVSALASKPETGELNRTDKYDIFDALEALDFFDADLYEKILGKGQADERTGGQA